MLETSLKEVLTAYRNLSFCDRTAFYYSVSNDVDVSESNLQVFPAKATFRFFCSKPALKKVAAAFTVKESIS